MSTKRFFFNGIDGATGRYLLPPLIPAAVAIAGLRDKIDPSELKRLASWIEDRAVDEDPKRQKRIFDGNPKDLAETGWGVILAHDVGRPVESALSKLLDHRKEAATRNKKDDYFQIFRHEPGQTAAQFLTSHGVRSDAAVNPDRGVPYYLLLVGSPESLPFQFQYELDVNYAVGRIYFDETEDYRVYAESVVAAETRARRPRQVALFGVRNENDPSTTQTADELIAPLGASLRDPKLDWPVDVYLGPPADRARLARLLGGSETPALLFTASHGVGFPLDDPRQLARQGGLICQDWPGPEDEAGVQREHYFTAEDLAADANLQGLVAFLFACYSGGTPDRDNFYDDETLGKPRRIADKPFISRLCQRLLAHPNGGALAVVGHVDRAWTNSFQGSGKGEGVDNYRNSLLRLLDGHSVGWAMEHFNWAHATLSTRLSNDWEKQHSLEDVDLEAFAELWMANNDARNFVVFGDPAVKLSARPETRRSGGD
jgi:peptidase C25-like protein